MDQTRPPNPNPSSLLWAHQIRREHIHIVKQFDILRTDLAVATDTMDDLKRDLETLTRHVEEIRQCNAQTQVNLLHLEGRLDQRLRPMLERINNLETENSLLKARLEVLEPERQHGCEREPNATGALSQKKQPQIKSPARQATVLKIACENGVFKRACTRGSLDSDRHPGMDATKSKPKSRLPGSEILAPDSMPTNESSPLPLLRPEDFVRSLSETTLSSSCICSSRIPENAEARDNQLRAPAADPHLGATRRRDSLTAENRSSLAALWAECDRSFKTSGGVEEVLVKDFVNAVSDTKTRILLEERCREVRCRSWDGLRALVHEIIGESRISGANERAMQCESDVRQEVLESADLVKPMLKRKRYIPIVPPDQEEQLVINAYGLGWLRPL